MTLQCEGASVRAGAKCLLADASAVFQAGRLCAVVGPNGAGKSTLLSVLSGQRRPDQGRVLLEGIELDARSAEELALMRAVMPQESAVAFDFTVAEVAGLGRYPHRRHPSRAEHEIVGQALQATAVAHLAERIFNTLSGGEKARVHLARSLAQVWEPRLQGERWLLLDEPTASLDLAHQHLAMRLLREWANGQGVGVVAVLHDLNLAMRYADDVIVLAGGAVREFGATRTVVQPALIEEVWGLPCHQVATEDGVPQYLFG